MTDLERLDAAFTLTPEQRSHVDSLLWLFSDRPEHRMKGRSHLLLYIFARLCIETPGSVAFLIEHVWPTSPKILMRLLADRLRDIILTQPTLIRRLTIAYDGPHIRLVYTDPLCANCNEGLSKHGPYNKCLFSATHFNEMDQNQSG